MGASVAQSLELIGLLGKQTSMWRRWISQCLIETWWYTFEVARNGKFLNRACQIWGKLWNTRSRYGDGLHLLWIEIIIYLKWYNCVQITSLLCALQVPNKQQNPTKKMGKSLCDYLVLVYILDSSCRSWFRTRSRVNITHIFVQVVQGRKWVSQTALENICSVDAEGYAPVPNSLSFSHDNTWVMMWCDLIVFSSYNCSTCISIVQNASLWERWFL